MIGTSSSKSSIWDALHQCRVVVRGPLQPLLYTLLTQWQSKAQTPPTVHLIVPTDEGVSAQDELDAWLTANGGWPFQVPYPALSLSDEEKTPLDAPAPSVERPNDDALLRECRASQSGSPSPIDLFIQLPGAELSSWRLDHVLREEVTRTERSIHLAKTLGNIPFLLCSHIDVAGAESGYIPERHPTQPAVPRAGKRGQLRFDVDHELAVCAQAMTRIEFRSQHADVTSRLETEALADLRAKGAPSRGETRLQALRAKQHQFCQEELETLSEQRAAGYGFPHGRAYAQGLAEHLVANSGLPYTVLRLASLIPSTAPNTDHQPPCPSGLRHLARAILSQEGTARLPLEQRLQLLPVDQAAAALHIHAVAHVKERSVLLAHITPNGQNPLSSTRFLELWELYVRKQHHAKRGAPAAPTLRLKDGALRVLESLRIQSMGTPQRDDLTAMAAEPFNVLSGWLNETSWGRSSLKQARSLFPSLSRHAESVLSSTSPSHTPSEYLSTLPTDAQIQTRQTMTLQRSLYPGSEDIFNLSGWCWRQYAFATLFPFLDKNHHVLTQEKPNAAPAYPSLVHLLIEVGERYQNKIALTSIEGGEKVDYTYATLLRRAQHVAWQLHRAGIEPGDRVLLSAKNHPHYALAVFGILSAGAVLVPVDPQLDHEQARTIKTNADLALAILDKEARHQFGEALGDLRILDLHLTTAKGPEHTNPQAQEKLVIPTSDDLASILFTSGTTGEPKGVMLSHGNFTSLIASLSSIFTMQDDDRALSLLPLHHTFEFSCGLLLPLMAGARIYYLDEVSGENVLSTLKNEQITGLIGVPAIWQLLERRIRNQAKDQGPTVEKAFNMALHLNQRIGEETGLDVGRLFFRRIHKEFGGKLRLLISGGAALPEEVHHLFQGLGLHLSEGYGLTESAPVLSVAQGGVGSESGTVGHAIPGVEIQIHDPDDKGVGEVWAKGPNIMRGYFRNPDATKQTLTEDGWLRTGDLGILQEDGQLKIVGRAKDVVVTASGENIYLDDVEKRLADIDGIEELALVGLPDAQGGERLGLAYVTANDHPADQALASLKKRIQQLPVVFRPTVVEALADPLPRTATRKVKRKVVVTLLTARMDQKSNEATTTTTAPTSVVGAQLRSALALVCGIDASEIAPQTQLHTDLAMDSLMWVELGSSLTPLFGPMDPEALFACDTFMELEQTVTQMAHSEEQTAAPQDDEAPREDAGNALFDSLAPALLTVTKGPARRALVTSQRELYRTLFQTTVEGRAHIPYNQNCIVVANHSSHLDTGLVKFALGPYGTKLRPFAGKDYFFEGHPLKVAYFEHFTNLVPLDRESLSGAAFQQAIDVMQQGHVVLIYPEGTRRTDGLLGDFKPLVGRLALQTGVPVLPMYLGGAFDALPKGSLVPKARQLSVHIGPPLQATELHRLTHHLPPVQAAREATGWIRKSVARLSQGQTLDLETIPTPGEDHSAGPNQEQSNRS